ncbi:Ger(x)C family spore germination protein [Paenibacillus sp. J5C_2022]|uniref:Ger(x)C family spore germination protein n=1 Tax=Paenibacillus sp. J5C2022 TaxID=2977129 RepID=UPI0021D18613|nr:Ger(x)C family spore germination protein [Paenibacillus sp. J5C2022]MCU6707471.1 Ger(x)C family spore germination protein [Paenibacillus sp. J5C2022]
MLIAAVFAAVALLTGSCDTDTKDIEKLNYATTIGVDFKDGKYIGYVQFVNLPSIAKQADGKKESAKIWIGKGKGETFEESFFDIYRTSQERIFWGHLTAIVISESAIKQGIESIYDSFSRYYEFRLTPWVFGTRASVEDILNAKGFYEQSPLSTILHDPEGIYSQSSQIRSIRLHRLMSQVNEPAYTTAIPTLTMNKKAWTNNGKMEPKLMIDGAIFLENEKYMGYIPLKQLLGLRWIQPQTIRAAIEVPSVKNPTVVMIVDKPKTKLTMLSDGDKPQFSINLKASGYITNRSKNQMLQSLEMDKATEEAIAKQIQETYDKARAKGIDIYNFQYQMFRYHNRLWKSRHLSHKKLIAKDTVKNISVRIKVKHTSSEKNTRVQQEKE